MNRRQIFRFVAGLWFLLLLPAFLSAQDILQFMKKQPAIKQITEIESNPFFGKTYEIMFRQPLNHADTTKGFFLQRVVVADKAVDRPVVLITEGYAANYATQARYLNELSSILDANQICIEHRYFGKSVPAPLNWDYLTVANAVADHHDVIQLLKKYYQSKWVSTGISKGGQTAMSHRSFYPGDVDVTVAYVGPLNFGVEDGRHEPFIARKAGSKSDRKAILAFQQEVLKRKAAMIPLLKSFAEKNKYTFRMSLPEVLDFCVLEYSFSFWQWGNKSADIPGNNSSDKELFDHLMKVASSDYFAEEGIEPTRPFFVQAARELGYYGYDTRKFKKWLTISTAKNYLSHVFLPEDMKIDFDPSTMRNLHRFLQQTDARMLFIYGENDPWSATAVNIPNKSNLIKMVEKGGSHKARINTFPKEQKEYMINMLKGWLEIK